MASYIKKKFFKDSKPLQKKEVYSCCLDDYDATYWLANKVLSVMFLKLNLDATNTDSRIFENIMFWFIMMNMFLATSLESLNIIATASQGTLIELFAMMPCVGYLLIAMLKIHKIKIFKQVYQNLVTELRTMWPVGQITEDEQKIIDDSLKSLRISLRAYFTSSLTLASIFVLPPFIVLIKEWTGLEKGHRFLTFLYWFPFDPLQDNIYEIVVVVQSCHCFCSVGCMLTGDLLYFIFLSHITTQFSLLAVKINKLIYVKPDNQLLDSYPLGAYSKDQFSEIEGNLDEKLKKIIQRHQALIRLSNDVENMYTFSLLVNFINSSIIICFCLFSITFVEKWNEFNYKVFFTTAILQIWFLCSYGQKLLDASSCVGDALYNSGWYISSQRNQKTILIMLNRSQKQVRITTYGFSIVSLESYATILKTSWSYFTLLINMYKE